MDPQCREMGWNDPSKEKDPHGRWGQGRTLPAKSERGNKPEWLEDGEWKAGTGSLSLASRQVAATSSGNVLEMQVPESYSRFS